MCNTPFPKIRNLNKIIKVKPQTEHYTAFKNSLIENKTIKLQKPTYKNCSGIFISILINPQVKSWHKGLNQQIIIQPYLDNSGIKASSNISTKLHHVSKIQYIGVKVT